MTLGIGTIHAVIGYPLDGYTSDGDIELDQNEVTVLTGMDPTYINERRT
jgi:hypothetical protein